MKTVVHVKHARKENSVAKVGESYYHWKFKNGPRCYSKEKPTASQLTRSEFLKQAYDLNDRLTGLAAKTKEDLDQELQNLVEDFRALGEEQHVKICHMPERLKTSPSALLLKERRDLCETVACALEDIRTDDQLLEEALKDVHQTQYQGE